MKKAPKILLLFLLLFLSKNAFAQGMYFSAHVGPNFRANSDAILSGAAVPGRIGTELDPDIGYVLGGAVGTFLNDFRVEGEISFRDNSIDPVPGLPLGSGLSALAFMVNGFYDINIRKEFTPYVGFGIGFARLALAPDGALNSDSDIVFAYQFFLGVSKPISPTVDVFLDYRHISTTDPSFSFAGLRVDTEFGSSEILIGGRLKF